MRKAFIDTITTLAEQDKDIYLLTADMGFGLVEQFADKFPKRFINVGVAEQNMIGVATGLALEGKKVFCYSIANFPTMRCLEQIRNDVCYHNLPVCIVSGGTGLWYGALGMTHHAVEDMAVMRVLPNMAVVCPGVPDDVVQAIKTIVVEHKKPCYLRLGKQFLDREPLDWEGYTDVAIIATGSRMLLNGQQAIDELTHRGIPAGITNLPVIKPVPRQLIADIAMGAQKVIITLEEHSQIGGLGSTVAEVLSDMDHAPLKIMGVADSYPTTAMSYEELLIANHLTVDDIVNKAKNALGDG